MTEPLARRAFLSAVAAAPLVPGGLAGAAALAVHTAKIRLSCNLYSFDAPLRSGGMSLEQVLDFCAERGITADVETIPIQEINKAYDRMLKGDVRYRFSIDLASLK